MIIDMLRLRIIGPRGRIGEVLDVLQEAAVFQPAGVRSPRLDELPGSAGRERRVEQLHRVLDDLEWCLAHLDEAAPADARGGAHSTEDLARWARLAHNVRRELADHLSEAAALEEERTVLTRYRGYYEALGRLMGADEGPARLRACPLVLDSEAAVGTLRRALVPELGDSFELRSETWPSGEVAALLLVPASRAGRLEELMGTAGVRELPSPPGVGDVPLAEAIPAIYDRLVDIDEREAALRRRRSELTSSHGAELSMARAVVRDHLAEFGALSKVRGTGRLFVIEGWVPADSEPDLRRRLESAFGDDVVLERIRREAWGDAEAEAPVVLRNPRLFRPFEAITRMMPLPVYGSIDPTPFVGVFFPAFFGLILGDVGYGLILGAGALVLHTRSRDGSTLRSISEIAGACAAASVVFGFLYGELFGDLGRRTLGLRPLAFDREEALVPFLALAVAIGFVHVVVGLVLGSIAAARHHSAREAVGRGISAFMVVLVAVALLAAIRILPAGFFSPVVIALLVAFPILVVTEGLLAPMELLSTLGNVLSYARIMALGTASVMMAVVANRMVGATGSVLVGVLFALLFHAVNFVLGVFGPTVHGLRLHYVEFFGKFYAPGGRAYRPLRTWEEPEGPAAVERDIEAGPNSAGP